MFKFAFGIVLIGAGFYKTLFHDPVWGLYLFAAFSHIRLEQLGGDIGLPLRIPILIASATFIAYVLNRSYRNKFRKWPVEVLIFAVMVIGMCVGSAMARFDAELTWKLSFDYVKFWIFFVLLIQMLDSIKKVEWFHWTLILSSAWLVYRCWDLRGTTGMRFENIGGGNIADGNHFAAALTMLFPFVFQETLSRNWQVATGAAILCVGIVFAIIITVSRGGLLGLTALSILILVAYPAQRFRNLVFIGAITGVVFMFATESQFDRLSTLTNAGSDELRDGSAQSRIDNWRLAFQLFLDNPWFGVGPGNFAYYSGMMVWHQDAGTPGHVTHSIWFELLSQGALVFGPFVLLLLNFFVRSWNLVRRYIAAGQHEMAMYVKTPMIGLGAFLVPATFIDRAVYEPIYWCIGLGVVHTYLAEEYFKKTSEQPRGGIRGHSVMKEP